MINAAAGILGSGLMASQQQSSMNRQAQMHHNMAFRQQAFRLSIEDYNRSLSWASSEFERYRQSHGSNGSCDGCGAPRMVRCGCSYCGRAE